MFLTNDDVGGEQHQDHENRQATDRLLHERYLEALRAQRREALIQGLVCGASVASLCWYFGLQLHILMV